MQAIIEDFRSTLSSASKQLSGISESESSRVPEVGQWSRKQILGHLIDSASNNHQRFVRAQLSEELIFPAYQQEDWVIAQRYQQESWSQLLELWQSYNRHLLHVMSCVPAKKLGCRCVIGSNQPVTLEFLIKDYLVHLKHHLRQILG